jgi:hypothetical protein
VNCVLHTDQKTSSYGLHQSLATENLVQHRYQKCLKQPRKNICAKLHQCVERNADAFLSRIITGDDTWVHQYDPLKKKKSPESHHQLSQHKKKIHDTYCFG